ncbi:MAG: MATE family efflux transporter [Peptoniphilus sp.]|nr:MATE family efflux transporter [Peptoniphilus sp.]
MEENKMGTKKINRLLFEMSIPIMISMLVQALYNIIDSYFVSQINEDAFAAVSLAFPVQYMITGLAVGTGVGINALLSRSLGQKKFERANRAAENGLILAVFHYLIFLVFGLFLSETFFKTQTDAARIISYGVDYISIITTFSVGTFVLITVERIFQSTGRTIYTMITQIFGVVINIILDPILIFGYLGAPAMGIRGAAVATVIAQIIAAILGLFINYKFNKEVTIRNFKPDFKVIKEIYRVGLPSFILIGITSLTIYFMNIILSGFSSTAVAALGAYFKLRSFIFLPVFGLNNAMVPIVAYNYGARNKERALEAVHLSIKIATGIMVAGFVIIQIFAKDMLMIFNASETMISIGVPALRIISFAYFFAGHNIVTSGSFQALGNGVLSLNSSLIRQVAALLPVAYLLSLTGNLNLVWLCYPISEAVDLVYCRYYLVNFTYKKIKN